jgi:predicted RNA-binding protein associated with RNAse of E/G family
VVEKPNGEKKIIDAEELEKLLDNSCISRELYEKAISEAKNIMNE